MSVLQFCETTIAKAISATINSARQLGFNAAVVGPAGVGKTCSLSHYVGSTDGAYLFTTSAGTGNATRHLFRRLSEALQIGGGDSIAQIQRRLFNYDLRGRVLIIDEAQNLNLQGIRELLYLNDHAQMSVVFCGNQEVLRRASVDTGPFAQVGSRIPFRKEVEAIDPADADAITNSYGVEGLDAYELMRGVAARHHARGVAFVLQAARALVGNGKAIKSAHIKEAFLQFPQYRPVLSKR